MGKKAKSAQPPAAASSNGAAPAASTASATAAKPSAERSEFLKLFWSLAESDASARAQAVAQLLAHLEQHAHEPAADSATEKESDLQYTLKRLVRGLASSRDAARQGFSTALAGLLAAFPAVALRDVQTLLRDAMEVHSNMKGMEQREHMFGRLFGLLALQRSGRLSADQRVAVEVVKELLEMAKWKKWLREACYEAALAVLADVTPDVFVADLAADLALCLAGDVSAFNAEQVLLAAGLSHYIHTAGIEAAVPAGFPALHFLRRKGMHLLAEPLKTSSACYPRVHAAWFSIFGHVLHTGKNAAQLDGELFQEAWTVLVDNMLLDKASATHERRGLAFKLFELVLPALPRPLLRAILTPHFVKCLFTNAVSKKNYLHDAARHTLKVFGALAPEEFAHFFQKQFVKPMATLVEIGADEDAEEEEEQQQERQDAKKARLSGGGFDALIALEEEKERAELVKKKNDNVRMWALDALVTSLAELFVKEDTSERAEQLRAQGLRFLVFHTFFVASGKPAPAKKKAKKAAGAGDVGLDAALVAAEPALSSAVLATALKRVLSLLSVKLSGESASVLSRFFVVSQELLATASLRHAFTEDVAAQMSTLAGRVDEVRKAWSAAADKEAAATKQLEAFLLLFMSSGVQLLDAEQRADAAVAASDLEKCYADLVANGGKKSKAKKAKKQEAAADEPNSVVVFTDLLMGLLSQDSSAMRDIVTHVFRLVLPLLNAESIQAMLNVLVPSADDDEEDADDDRVTRREDEEEEDDDEEGDDDEDMEADEVVLTSAEDVSKALSADPKFAELHREDMALAAIVGHVKDRANRKKNAKRAAMQMLHFKLRVLDLLQVFATKCATSPLVLTLVLPLFQALVAIQKTDKDARVLSERLQAVLNNKVLRAKEVPSGAELSAAQRQSAAESLAAAVELLTKKSLEKDQAGKVGAGVVVYFVRVLCNGGGGDAKKQTAALVQDAVTAAVVDAFTKKHSRFPQSVFDDLITRFPLVAVHVLLQPLAQIASATASAPKKAKTESEDAKKATLVAADEFSACEVFRLLSLLLKPKLLADEAAQQAVRGVLASLQAALLAVVRSQQQSDKAELKTKRMKLVLSFALHLVKAWKQLHAAESKPLVELLAALTALESNSPVVKSMVKQIAEASELPAAIAAAAAMKVKTQAAAKSTKAAAADTNDDEDKDDEDKDKAAEKATKQTKAAEKKTQKAKQALDAAKKQAKTKTPIAKKRKRAAQDAGETEG